MAIRHICPDCLIEARIVTYFWPKLLLSPISEKVYPLDELSPWIFTKQMGTPDDYLTPGFCLYSAWMQEARNFNLIFACVINRSGLLLSTLQ